MRNLWGQVSFDVPISGTFSYLQFISQTQKLPYLLKSAIFSPVLINSTITRECALPFSGADGFVFYLQLFRTLSRFPWGIFTFASISGPLWRFFQWLTQGSCLWLLWFSFFLNHLWGFIHDHLSWPAHFSCAGFYVNVSTVSKHREVNFKNPRIEHWNI